MRKILLVFCVVLVGSFSGCDKKTHNYKPEPVVEYYPFKVGNFWEYHGKTRWYEYYLKKEVIDFYVMRGSMGAYKVRYFSTFYFFADTVEHKNEWFTYQALIDNEVREFSDLNDPDAYEILIRFPLQVGSFWRKPPIQTDSLVVVSMFVDSVAVTEDVTTPAGEFADSYKILKIPLYEGLDFFGEKRWFKPGIGFVKYWNANGGLPFEYSLINYKITR